jgi:DNA-binding NtrC family response regulator
VSAGTVSTGSPQASSIKILVADDNHEALLSLEQILTSVGYQVESATNGTQALEIFKKFSPDICLLDVQMPGIDGYHLAKTIKSDKSTRATIVILLTALDSLEDVVKGFEEGADDYIKKPYRKEELLVRLQAALRLRNTYMQLRQMDAELQELKSREGQRSIFSNIVGSSRPMQAVFSLIEKVADSDVPILISGESGTGKELVAKAVHYQSSRKNAMFVAQNCSAFNENLLESELFGHVKGAFTGAIRDKQGLFEVADGGTFFLDELGEMSASLQVKLLRVLQEGVFIPVGATKEKQVNVRVVAATNRNLKDMVAKGTFREDLYYRLNVVEITLPPLRERRDDIPLLATYFLKQIGSKKGVASKELSRDAESKLSAYYWPGNIRELENEIERAVLMLGSDNIILPEHLSAKISEDQTRKADSLGLSSSTSLGEDIEALEKAKISMVLRKLNWNKSEAAKVLGISRSSLISKVQEYKLEDVSNEELS